MNTIYNEFQISKDEEAGIVTMTLSKEPGNALDLDMLTNITTVLKEMDADSSVKGALITSKFNGKAFLLGLNPHSLLNSTRESATKYWKAVQELHITMYIFSKPLVAAINGDAIAGGCWFALACDYRVMVHGKHIGLAECKFGIPTPFFFVDLMTAAVGQGNSARAVLGGELYCSEQALKIGLVDQVADLDMVPLIAASKLKELAAIPQPAYKLTKLILREAYIEKFRKQRDENVKITVDIIQQPYAQQAFVALIKQMGF